ncbi:MAG: complex I NDUFA9 subunit family protein [Gammaproteobacteria bacterium]
MKINSVCVLGGTGFVGHHVCAQLVDAGYRVTVLTRRPDLHRDLLVLPTLKLVEADVHEQAELEKHFQGMDAVINLVGILNEKGFDGSGFRHAHVELAKKVVAACRSRGVRRLLHMSALNADAANGPSYYLRTKGEAENHVHTFSGGSLAVTSFRPSVIFGPGDSFINRFANLMRRIPFVFPLACPDARFAPVYVGDVAEAFVRALEDRGSFGLRLDLCGPRAYTLRGLLEYTARTLGLRRWIVDLPDWLSYTQAVVMEHLPGKVFTVDNYNSLKLDSVCTHGAMTCRTAVEAVVPLYLGKHGRDARYQAYRREAKR